MRRLFPLLLCAALAACSPGEGTEPFTDSRIPPTLAQRYWPPAGWAWGLVQPIGAPPIRYGVSGPSGVAPKGDILILAGFGESAETWFETVRTLNQRGYVVWVMEGLGQAGSGRYGGARDVAHVPDFDPEVRAVAFLAGMAKRPPLILAQDAAAPSALRAVARSAPNAGVVLVSPVFDAGERPVSGGAAKAAAGWMAKIGLGALRAQGQPAWERPGALPKGRDGLAAAWRQANPDLRFGGASWGWIEAFQRHRAALVPSVLKRIETPVLMLPSGRPVGRAARICQALPRCIVRSLPDSRQAPHLGDDAVYQAWLNAVLGALPPPPQPGT